MGQNTLVDHMHIQSIRSRHRACNIFPPLLDALLINARTVPALCEIFMSVYELKIPVLYHLMVHCLLQGHRRLQYQFLDCKISSVITALKDPSYALITTLALRDIGCGTRPQAADTTRCTLRLIAVTNAEQFIDIIACLTCITCQPPTSTPPSWGLSPAPQATSHYLPLRLTSAPYSTHPGPCLPL